MIMVQKMDMSSPQLSVGELYHGEVCVGVLILAMA